MNRCIGKSIPPNLTLGDSLDANVRKTMSVVRPSALVARNTSVTSLFSRASLKSLMMSIAGTPVMTPFIVRDEGML